MMVNADRLLSLFKQSARKSKPPYIPTVQSKKDIIYHVFRQAMANLIRPCQHVEGIRDLL